MPLYRLGNLAPLVEPSAFVAPSADLIGEVHLGQRASVWFGAIVRADNTPIVIGEDSNLQDGTVCHSDAGFPLTIGARVTIGHQAILHGCSVSEECLVGMGARILNGALIEPHCIVGAGALITEGKHFESRSLILGVPARVVRRVTSEEIDLLRASAAHYANKARRYAEELEELT